MEHEVYASQDDTPIISQLQWLEREVRIETARAYHEVIHAKPSMLSYSLYRSCRVLEDEFADILDVIAAAQESPRPES